MARGRVKIGNRKLQSAVAEYGDLILEEVRRIVVETGQIILSNARTLARDDTGNLKQSIEMEIFDGGLKVVVHVGAGYAIFVEHGTGIHATGPGGSQAKTIPWTYFNEKTGQFVTTSGMEPKPFWFPAVRAGQRYFHGEMRRLSR